MQARIFLKTCSTTLIMWSVGQKGKYKKIRAYTCEINSE